MYRDILIVHRATEADFEGMLEIKSDPEDVRWSGFASAPDRQPFLNWFVAAIESVDRLIYSATMNDRPAGYAHFSRAPVPGPELIFDMSYGIAPAFRGRGLARSLIINALSFAASDCQRDDDAIVHVDFRTWIAENNRASERAVSKAGFIATTTFEDRSFLYPEPRTERGRIWVYAPA